MVCGMHLLYEGNFLAKHFNAVQKCKFTVHGFSCKSLRSPPPQVPACTVDVDFGGVSCGAKFNFLPTHFPLIRARVQKLTSGFHGLS